MSAMKLVNMGRGGLLPLLLAAGVGCSDMNPAQDTFQTVYGPLLTGGAGGSGGEGGGSAGNAGAAGTQDVGEPGLPPEWACLANPTQRTEITPQPARITYIVPIVDFDSQPIAPSIVEGLNVSFCVDAACTQFTGPDVIPVANPDPNRPFLYALSIPYNLSNLTIKLEATGYATMYYILGGPMVGTPSGGTTVVGQAIAMLKTGARDELYQGLGLDVPAAANRGDLAVRTLNCKRDTMGQTYAETRARDVTLGASPVDEGAVPYSLSYGNRAAANRATDNRGVAGFASLDPQNYTVWGIAPIGDEGMPFGETVVPVRGGAITLLEVREGLGDSGWGQ